MARQNQQNNGVNPDNDPNPKMNIDEWIKLKKIPEESVKEFKKIIKKKKFTLAEFDKKYAEFLQENESDEKDKVSIISWKNKENIDESLFKGFKKSNNLKNNDKLSENEIKEKYKSFLNKSAIKED